MTVTADGKTAIIALGHVDQVAFVDTISRIVTHYVPVGRWARDIALSADERRSMSRMGRAMMCRSLMSKVARSSPQFLLAVALSRFWLMSLTSPFDQPRQRPQRTHRPCKVSVTL
jgi:hypothetical protein